MFKIAQKTLRTAILLSGFLVAVAGALLVWFWFGIHSQNRTVDSGIALWMDHRWSTSKPGDWEILKAQLQDYPVTELYFHVGPLDAQGQLPSDLAPSTEILATLSTTPYAWLGQIRSQIDLDNPTVRQGIVQSAQVLLEQGFEGIHLDIEPIREDDEGFYSLLADLRTAFPSVPLSVAMDEWQPDWLSGVAGRLLDIPVTSYWTTAQINRVTPYIDELVVMTYDTGFKDPGLYAWWVEQETIALSNRVPDNVRVFIGIPAYDTGTQFDPHAENVATGLAGYQQGVHNWRSKLSTLSGVAIYPYWLLTDDEWETLKSL